MKNLFVIFAVVLCGLASCQKNTSEPEEPEVVEVKAERIYLPQPPIPHLSDTGYIVNSEQELKAILLYQYESPSNVDFSRYTIVGAGVGRNGTDISGVYWYLRKNIEEKKYTFQIDTKTGIGGAASPSCFVWLLIPKIEPGAIVNVLDREIGNEYVYDPELKKNIHFWLSDSEYGASKTVFKKREPVFLNYSFKNSTSRTIEWYQKFDGAFVRFAVYSNKSGIGSDISDKNYGIRHEHNGKLKPNEEIRYSWRVSKEIASGEWTATGDVIRDFKYLWLDPKKLEFTVEN